MRVHYSDLKQMAKSPAHYRHYISAKRPPTPAMVLGSAIDAFVFGGKVACYDGVRNGKAWEAFKADRADSVLLNTREYEAASNAAAAVLGCHVAGPLIRSGRHQVVLQWDQDGIPMASGIEGERGGLDVLGDGYVLDLKSTTCTEPEKWKRHAIGMLYHVQLAAYRSAARANGHTINACYLAGVEVNPPYCVTVLKLSDALLEEGDKILRAWTERLKGCIESDQWPGYVQSVVECDVPAWHGLEGLEDE